MQPWIAEETRGADFGDERLDARYRLLLDRLSAKPSLSIPAACGGPTQTQAAYRRECPPLPCDAVFSEAEWKSVYQIQTGQAAPKQAPLWAEMVRWIAGLGGYLGRKCDGPPGPKVMWIGLQRMRDFATAWVVFSRSPPCSREAKR